MASSNNYLTIMASVEKFKTAIVNIRNILWSGCGIAEMDSMQHICFYLLSRHITRERVAALEVPNDFAWETLIDTAQTKNGGVQKALDCFYHPEEDCLVRHFDRLFGTDKFTFEVKNPQKHKEILEILNDINITDVDSQMDVLGWVYEQHLSTGSGNKRDTGQFFTDRSICKYMTELCKPDFKMPGVPESVCDPAMGTGGFLTAFIKYFKKHHADKPINWLVQQKEIHGCDKAAKITPVCRMNIFMETGGIRATNLITNDSLYHDLTQPGYDIILANMPFGLKGITHAECCERVKSLKIRGTKSEPLFLQLMMVSLNIGGRCAVVVPDGMLVNSSSCHNDTRKYLLDNFDLKRVIKMKGQFFMNTGIQPSILFFEKTGKPTEAVEFWEVVKGDKGEITETMVVSVPRTKIDATSSFDMRRYLEAEKPVANPAGFPMVKLGDLFDIPSIKKRYTNKDSSTTGIPFYNGCYNSPLSFINTKEPSYSSPSEYLIMIKDGGGNHYSPTVGLGKIFMVKGDVCLASQNTVLIPKNNSNSLKFIYYTLCIRIKDIRDLSKPSINLEHISIKNILDFPIQLPPLSIQEEIVATLDRIYSPGTIELADTLKMTDKAMDLVLANPTGATLEPIVEAQRLIRKSAQMVADVKAQMVADVKAQMVAIVKSVESRGFQVGKIGDYFESPTNIKKFNSKDMANEGDVPFFNGKWNSPVGFHTSESYNNHLPYFVGIKDGGGDHSSDKVGMGKFFKVSGKCAITSHNVILIQKSSDVLYDYVYYYLYVYAKELRDKAKYSINLGSISIKDIYNFPIIIPPIPFQEALISRLDALQSQLTSLETLQKQSEDNARFILESYLGTSSTQMKEIPDEESSASDDGASSTAETTEDENPFPHGLPMESSHSPTDVIGEAAAPAKAEKQTIKITRPPRRKLVVKS